MFSAYCKHCRRNVLLSLDDIYGMRHTSNGIEVSYRCLNAHEGVWMTGRKRR